MINRGQICVAGDDAFHKRLPSVVIEIIPRLPSELQAVANIWVSEMNSIAGVQAESNLPITLLPPEK
jgi:hypothetical protein